MSEDERRRKSWREIDQQRDRSAQRREERPAGATPRGGRGQQSYRAALDRLFDSGRIGQLVAAQDGAAAAPEPGGAARQGVLRQLAAAEGREAVTAALEAYFAGWGWPDELELLVRVLEHREPMRQAEAIERLLARVEQERPRRVRAVLGQLRLIRDTAEDDHLVALAQRLLDRLE